jgi:hypothetical protein
MIENNIKNINNILNTQLSNSDNIDSTIEYKSAIKHFNEIIKKLKQFHIIESHQKFLISKTSTEKDFLHYHTLKGAMVFLKEIHKLHLFALLGLTDYLNDFEKNKNIVNEIEKNTKTIFQFFNSPSETIYNIDIDDAYFIFLDTSFNMIDSYGAIPNSVRSLGYIIDNSILRFLKDYIPEKVIFNYYGKIAAMTFIFLNNRSKPTKQKSRGYCRYRNANPFSLAYYSHLYNIFVKRKVEKRISKYLN